MPEAVRGRTGNGSSEGVEEGAVMSENQQVDSEKQKVPEINVIESEQNTSERNSEELEMGNAKDKTVFFSLCPSVLENIEGYEVYFEGLDYAFKDNEIKNIAITGIYGSGKSTLWRTYVKERALKNIVTVMLGQFESSDYKEFRGSSFTDMKGELQEENRIERKLINQILSQINIKDCPLTKYKIKRNKLKMEVFLEIMCIVLFLLSIISWCDREWVLLCLKEIHKNDSKFPYLILSIVVFMVPLCFFLFRFVKNQSIMVHKIQVKGVETNINNDNIEDESVLEKDIKEIIYLLTSAKVEVLVIEDLDRFDNINIFIKLRELNFMLNQYLKANHIKKVAKFVYMVRDGILESKDRVKFFDFVLPVLPYIYPRNSETILLKEMKRFGFNIYDRIIIVTSLYIDEMRILKNIINEYQIYAKIHNINHYSSNKDKLFSLLVIKNLFPHEFDLLQMNQGYLYNLFHKKEDYISSRRICKTLESRIRGKDEKLDEINLRFLELLNRCDSLSLSEFLDCIMSVEENVNDYFEFVAENTLMQQSHSFPLIKFLVQEGYFAEDYYFYISPFHADDLTENDRIVMKKFYGGENIVFTKIENPAFICSRLRKEDYMKSNILNRTLLEYVLWRGREREDSLSSTIEKEFKNYIALIMDSIHRHNKYIELLAILSFFDNDYIDQYVRVALQIKFQYFETILQIVSGKREVHEDKMYSEKRYRVYKVNKKQGYKKIRVQILRMIMLCPKQKIQDIFSAIKDVKQTIEENSSVFMVFDIQKLNIIFVNLMCEKICFRDTDFWKNINILVSKVLSEMISYGELVGVIYKHPQLQLIRRYIELNFNECIIDYISHTQEMFSNLEEVVVDILNSGIPEEDKIKYIENNTVQIKDINMLEISLEGNITKKLFVNNIIFCSKQNITKYFNEVGSSYAIEFVEYLNKNINESNAKEILGSIPELCKKLVLDDHASPDLLDYALEYE